MLTTLPSYVRNIKKLSNIKYSKKDNLIAVAPDTICIL